MKNRSVIHIFLCFALSSLISCNSEVADGPHSPVEQARVDSIVRVNRSIDSLVVILERFAEEGSRQGQVSAYRELGRAYRNATRYQEAIEAHRKGLEIAEEIRDTLQIVQALNNIGTAYRRMGVLEEAASWHYRGLALCEQWSDTASLGLKNRVVSLNGLGNLHLSMGKDTIAMDLFREALKGEAKLGSTNGMAINYANIGALFESRGQIDSARYYYGRSLECNELTGSELGISLCHVHFGRLAENDGDLDTAFYEYKSAYDVLSAGPDRWHWLESCISLARISMKKTDFSAARRYLAEALDAAEGLESVDHLADIYHLYYLMDKKAGRYRESLVWLEKYLEYMNRIYTERNEEVLFQIRSNYEREKNMAQMQRMREAHSLKEIRDRMMLVSLIIVLALAVLTIVFLIYSLRLRSRNNQILKELDKTKNNYFTNVAHEFRTPLTIIQSAARSISDNAEDDSLKDDASDITRHSKDLLNLVNQVLDIAKMTSGLAPDPVWRSGNIVAFISGICERNRRYAQSKGITLDFNCASSPVVEMDFVPDLMVRIVQNLLSNAFKFSEKGTAVTVSLYRSIEKSGGCIHVSVRDQGVGMTPEQSSAVFEPFYQVEGGFRDMGTGIGLSLVKLAAETMGGNVTVDSTVGKGTEFIVDIPVRHDLAVSPIDESMVPEGNNILEHVSSSVADDTATDSDVPRILIVEDMPEVARWEMRQLGPDYAFYFAPDGAEGLRKAEDIVPDLIITDVMMPVMDGLEMCRRIRKSELLCHIPVIMVTARATHEDRLKGLEAGADAYMEKPYDESELDLRVRKLLQQRSMLKKMFSERFDSHVCDNSDESTISVTDRIFLDRFDVALENAFASGKVDCEDLASEMYVGRAQLNRKIKAITGYKTTEYILMARLSKAKHLLRTTELPVSEIAMQCGIEDVGYFSTLFRKHVGVTPTIYRNS